MLATVDPNNRVRRAGSVAVRTPSRPDAPNLVDVTVFDPGGVRIGTDERQRAVDALGDHFAKGRLDPDEFEQRATAAYAARTAGELDALFRDLPRPPVPAVVGMPLGPPLPHPWSLPAPHGREQATGMPYSDKYKRVAGMLQILVPAGTGRLYSGKVGLGLTQLIVTALGILAAIGGGSGIVLLAIAWCWIDGIAILAGRPLDRYGRPLR